MPLLFPVTLSAFHLEDNQLRSTQVVDNLCVHRGTLNYGGSNLYRTVLIHKKHLVESVALAFTSLQAIDLNCVALSDLELPAPRF